MSLLSHGLLPASFRGVPFGVLATDEQLGRRVAMHVYPGRDEPWAEDMGRAPRAFRLRGFIVADDRVYAGGPIQLQRLLIMAAAEKWGSGVLTHPTLGVLQVACRGLSLGQDLAAGTMSEISFEFVESGKRSFPSLLSSGSGLLSAATLCDLAIAADVVRAVALAAGGGDSPTPLKAAGLYWIAKVEAQGRDATALVKLSARLPGNLGRYAPGANAGIEAAAATTAATTIGELTTQASTNRAAIADAAAVLGAAIAAVAGADIAAGIAALLAALLAACADPADAVRLLIGLASYAPPGGSGVTAYGAAIGRAFRRAAGVALARAVAVYQPSSYDDASALLARVSTLLDAIATEAADAGDDVSYAKLRALRVEVVQDLRARGAQLARVRTFAASAPLPALVLAQRFYRDPSRADQLVRQADPASPLFMPTRFQALAA
jgi:prophage DNA circulation protein